MAAARKRSSTNESGRSVIQPPPRALTDDNLAEMLANSLKQIAAARFQLEMAQAAAGDEPEDVVPGAEPLSYVDRYAELDQQERRLREKFPEIAGRADVLLAQQG